MAANPLRIEPIPGGFRLSGELTRRVVGEFEQLLHHLDVPAGSLRIELAEFEIADGMAAVAAVNAVRRLAIGRRVVLVEAPQILGHNLYRVGALEGDTAITLEAMREDEAYG